MRRAILVGTGTVVGLVAVLAYRPGSLFPTAPVEPTLTPIAAPIAAPTQTLPASFTGSSVSTEYGPVQVEISIVESRITAVSAIDFPSSDPRSDQINATAIPALEEQTLAAQSAAIDGVSGASYTSAGFIESLQSALVKAGM